MAHTTIANGSFAGLDGLPQIPGAMLLFQFAQRWPFLICIFLVVKLDFTLNNDLFN